MSSPRASAGPEQMMEKVLQKCNWETGNSHLLSASCEPGFFSHSSLVLTPLILSTTCRADTSTIINPGFLMRSQDSRPGSLPRCLSLLSAFLTASPRLDSNGVGVGNLISQKHIWRLAGPRVCLSPHPPLEPALEPRSPVSQAEFSFCCASLCKGCSCLQIRALMLPCSGC